jgi:hypothetical protein
LNPPWVTEPLAGFEEHQNVPFDLIPASPNPDLFELLTDGVEADSQLQLPFPH